MKALIRDRSVLLAIGIGLIVFGAIYAINGFTQGFVRVPVTFQEGQTLNNAVTGLYTKDALIQLPTTTFIESFAHRNVSSGMLAVLVGCALLVRARELKKNHLSGWNISALILIAAGIIPMMYAKPLYQSVLEVHSLDLTASVGVVGNAWPLVFVGLALWLGRKNALPPVTPQQPIHSSPLNLAEI